MAILHHKSGTYVQQLDNARSSGNWEAVPELTRKIRKHAPDRSCLVLTAETERAVSNAILEKRAPATAGAPSEPPVADLDVATMAPKLLDAIGKEAHAQDRFQAQVCVGWLYWVVGDFNQAAAHLPASLTPEVTGIDSFDGASEWTKVCAVKAAYLRANTFLRAGNLSKALLSFRAALPMLAGPLETQPRGKQLRYWSELYLTEYAMCTSQSIEDGSGSMVEPYHLTSYRAWAKFWQRSPAAPLHGGYGFPGSVPRRRIWYDYYAALSTIVDEDLPYFSPNAEEAGEQGSPSELRTELKSAEATYQALLLEETKFPHADEERSEVETFVHIVMRNWTIMAGRSWQEFDLGPAGREGFSRGVLDTLYRAATRTFHSTAILRHIFTIHLSLAEFDLAFKTFDSYMAITKKGKAQVQKTGRENTNIDTDAQFIETMAHCTMALCRYGDRSAAEKALHLSEELAEWVERLTGGRPAASAPIANKLASVPDGSVAPAPPAPHNVPPNILALAWQAVGLAQANWSRTTFNAEMRPEIQLQAMRSLKKSLSPEYGCSGDVRTLFALGLILAERRDINSAIAVLKAALITKKLSPEQLGELSRLYLQERLLLPLWHLLALLMSARQDYAMATKFCEGALQQFKDHATLYGAVHDEPSTPDRLRSHTLGLVDEMDDFERETLLEIKMTQLALVELLEGPDAAVNGSYELLSLYARLFADDQPIPPSDGINKTPTQSTVMHSLRPGSTTWSIKDSLLYRSDKRLNRRSARSVFGSPTDGVERPSTTHSSVMSLAPAVNEHAAMVVDDSSVAKPSMPTRRRASLRWRDTPRPTQPPPLPTSISQPVLPISVPQQQTATDSRVNASTVVDGETFFTPMEVPGQAPDFFAYSSKAHSAPPRRPPPVRRSLTFLSSLGTSSAGMHEQLLRILLPPIQFSKEHEQRRRTAILVKVWLTIAGFYRRAGMFSDCREAIEEAQKHASLLERDVVYDGASENHRTRPDWAFNQSVEQLLADCWTEHGKLSVARGDPNCAITQFEAALVHDHDHPDATISLSNLLLDIYSEKLLPDNLSVVPPLATTSTHFSGPLVLSAAPVVAATTTTTHSTMPAGTGAAAISPESDAADRNEKRISDIMNTTLPTEVLGLAGGVGGCNKSNTLVARPDTLERPLSRLDRWPPPQHASVDVALSSPTSTSSPPPPSAQGRPGTVNPPVSAVYAGHSGTFFPADDDDSHQSRLHPQHHGPRSSDSVPPAYKARSLSLLDRLAARDRAHGLLSGLTRRGSGWNVAEAWFALARAHEESGMVDKARDVLWWCVELEEAEGVRPWTVVGGGRYVL